MKISILLLIGIAGLWFFGRTQPIVVVESAFNNTKQVACPKCGGSGSVEVPAACPKCNGTGKGEWYFKSKSKQNLSSQSKPACLTCRGTGKAFRSEKCAQCKGTGHTTADESRKTKTVRADLSLWEKILAYCLIKPNVNCRPQRRLNGSYPLIAKYIETMVNPAYNARVIKWEPARLEDGEWIVKAMIEFNDANGKRVKQGREFIVANREVKGARKEAGSQ